MKNKFARISSNINHVYLMLTEACPLDCEYCYIKDRQTKNNISDEAIDELVSSFEYHTPRIIYFGGEPLLEIEQIKRVTEKWKHKCQFQVITSGLVNFDKFIDEVYQPNKEKFDIQISWDGFENDNRLLRNGKNKQDRVMSVILTTLEMGIPLQVRSVINDENVDNLEKIYLTYRYLKQLYPHLTGDITIAHQKQFKDDFPEKFRNQYKKTLSIIQSDIENGIDPYLPLEYMKKMTTALNGRNVSSCDAGNYLVLKPNGDLYPCTILSQQNDDVDFKMGSIYDRDLDYDMMDKMRQPSEATKCKSCNVRSVCDGGCRYERVANFGENWQEKVCGFTCGVSEAWFYETVDWVKKIDESVYDKFIQRLVLFNNWVINYDCGKHDDAKKFQTFDRKNIQEKERVDFYKVYRDATEKKIIPIMPVSKRNVALAEL
ncbi:MAG: radical SAM protein [Sediminibacterium sp.]